MNDIKVGERWISRNGEVYTIINRIQGNEFQILAVDSKKRMISFTKEGFFVGKQFPHENDLVSYV